MTCEGTCDTKRKGNGDSNSCSCVSSQCWGLGPVGRDSRPRPRLAALKKSRRRPPIDASRILRITSFCHTTS